MRQTATNRTMRMDGTVEETVRKTVFLIRAPQPSGDPGPDPRQLRVLQEDNPQTLVQAISDFLETGD